MHCMYESEVKWDHTFSQLKPVLISQLSNWLIQRTNQIPEVFFSFLANTQFI